MSVLTEDLRRTQIHVPEKLHSGLDGLSHGIVGRVRRRRSYHRSLMDTAEAVHASAIKMHHLSDRHLRERLADQRDAFRSGRSPAMPLVQDALSCIAVAAERSLGLRPFPVQLMGALALHKSNLAEMATGEGKTLTACLPAVMAAWTGRACHIITVNDYLADRDAHNMAPLYKFCGVQVGCVTSQMDPLQRRHSYRNGVVYTTSKEIVADFLRDRLVLGDLHHPARRLLYRMRQPQLPIDDRLVLSGLHTAIVDEADSVLIDEAVTPLIISRPRDNQPLVDACQQAFRMAEGLERGVDYLVDTKYREVRLSETGKMALRAMSEALPGLWRGAARREELVVQALTAREFYREGKQYVVQDEKVVIVDEFTGRLMANRTWRHGLHQAVESKEGLEPSSPSETLARISFQRFFRFFQKLSGMTGTAKDATGEFWSIYNLPVIPIPTNRPCIREMWTDGVFAGAQQKWAALIASVKEIHETGRPVLVGTRNVQTSELLANMLDSQGLEYDLLNAVHHKEEARIVASAGQIGRITIATNMAGRGTDIILGRGVSERGGLHVIASERHESRRIDRQLFGRCARQGDPGSAQAFISMDDELIQRFVPVWLRRRIKESLAKEGRNTERLSRTAMYLAQQAAQRLAFRQRKNVLQMDTWMEEALAFTGPGMRF